MKKSNLLIISTIFLSSCLTKVEDCPNPDLLNQYPIVLDIEENMLEVDTLPLSYIATELDYIALETTNNSLIRTINEIKVTDSLIFINTEGRLLRFSRLGMFNFQVGNIGRGPQEYFCRSFCVDDENNRLFIYGNYDHKIHVVSIDGDYLEYIPDPLYPLGNIGNILYYNGNLLMSHTITSGSDKSFFSVYDIDCDSVIYDYKNRYSTGNKKLRFLTNYQAFNKSGSEVQFKENYCDTVFATDDFKNIYPKYILRLGSKKLTFEENIQWQNGNSISRQDNYKITNFYESTRFLLFITRNLKGERILYIYDKEEDKAIFSKTPFIKNDIDGGPYLNFQTNISSTIISDKMYCVIKSQDFTKSMMSNMSGSIEDNPTIVSVTLK